MIETRNWLPPVRRTLTGLLLDRAQQLPDRVALTIGGENLTYEALVAQSNGMARGLLDIGVRRGDAVAIFAENCVEHVLLQFATARIGALEVAINTAYRGEFLAHPLRDSGANALIVDSSLLHQALPVIGQLPDIKTLIVLGDSGGLVGNAEMTVLDAGVLRQNISSLVDVPDPAWDDPCAILYTSGTTGPAKGALLTNNYWVTFAENDAMVWTRGRECETFFSVGPLFHLSAKGVGVLSSIYAGGRCVQEQRFSATTFWRRVREEGCCATLLVGSMVVMLWRQPPSPEEGIELVFATPCPAELQPELETRWRCEFHGGYGSSEAGQVSCSSGSAPYKPGTVGKPIDTYVDVRIFGEDDEELPVGEVGEIVIRPKRPHVLFEGYYNNAQATVARMSGLWYHTGDLGKLDEGGYLYFLDRKEDYIRRRGENISSQELEKVINEHPAVLECAIIGIKSDLLEEEVKAIVILRPGVTLTNEEFAAYCIESMPYFAVPRYVEFVSDVPRTPSGKIQKGKLREQGISAAWDREAAGIVLSGKRPNLERGR